MAAARIALPFLCSTSSVKALSTNHCIRGLFSRR